MIHARWYKNYLLVPVFDDDDGTLDYWDVHENHDEQTVDCDPVAWGLLTLAEAKAWVNKNRLLDRTIAKLEVMTCKR